MAEGHGTDLDSWAAQVWAAGMAEMEPFLTGLDPDHDAAVAGLNLPYSNGPAEGTNTTAKLIKRRLSYRNWMPGVTCMPPLPGSITGGRTAPMPLYAAEGAAETGRSNSSFFHLPSLRHIGETDKLAAGRPSRKWCLIQ